MYTVPEASEHSFCSPGTLICSCFKEGSNGIALRSKKRLTLWRNQKNMAIRFLQDVLWGNFREALIWCHMFFSRNLIERWAFLAWRCGWWLRNKIRGQTRNGVIFSPRMRWWIRGSHRDSQLLKFKAMNCTRQKRRKQCNGHCGTIALLAYSKACHETAPKKMKQKNQWKSLRSTKTHVHPLVLELESWQSEFRICQNLHGKAKRLSG